MNKRDNPLNYEIHNARLLNKKPAILFFHGFLGSLHDWNECIGLLGDSFPCMTVDMPGHGKSVGYSGANEYSMSRTAEYINDIIDEVGLEDCIVAGYSMGGRFGLYFALSFPGRVKGALLESASPGLSSQIDRDRRHKNDLMLAERLKTGKFRSFIDEWYDQPLFESLRSSDRFSDLKRRRLKNDPLELANSLEYMSVGRQPSLWERLADVDFPILLLAGEYDSKFVKTGVEFAEKCERASLKKIEGCGHNVHFEKKDAFVKALVEFIDSL